MSSLAAATAASISAGPRTANNIGAKLILVHGRKQKK
jgi:hypothetical protein